MTNTSKPVIGWIGLGDQGAPMARAIAQAGGELHVRLGDAASPLIARAVDGAQALSELAEQIG